ncbi:MAG: hypothetical protein P1U68_00255 [Verrucomicrobiales bacterium]|nr:hypothetical protein [Verrucomicrobiales bacterium]
MKVLKFAMMATVCSVILPVGADDAIYDLDRIETESGRVYRNILILNSDRHGLLFRHAVGIAKLDFQQLSMNLRMLYEPVGDEEGVPGGMGGDERDVSSPLETIRNLKVTVTAANRIEFPLFRWNDSGVAGCHQYRKDWPNHWSRFDPALCLSVPECRALAVKDFLITTGLAARPPGVVTYRIPFRSSFRLY